MAQSRDVIIAGAGSILAAGRQERPLCTMGPNVRAGLEDLAYVGEGGLAKSRADQVTRMRAILEAPSLEIASPAEARSMQALKDGDQVAL